MKTELATLGGGCFWCLEAAYQRINGVTRVTSGYAGGEADNPTYQTHRDHAEVVQLEFDPAVINYSQMLEIFWTIHDPTTLNRQGADVGTQYRSMILYHNDAQRDVAAQSKAEVQKLWDDPVVTEIKPFQKFYEAESEHQNYYRNHSDQGYCQIVINPKLAKLREKFADRLSE